MSEAPVLHERDLLVLAKMLAMLGTSNDAERSVVGAKVHAWVTQRGVVWADLLVPPEPPEVEVSVNVGGRPAAAPQRPAQPPPGPQHSNSATGHNWARGPAWGALVEVMLSTHVGALKGDRERTFLADQLGRAMQYGAGTRLSDKQEQWMRDILGRASLTW